MIYYTKYQSISANFFIIEGQLLLPPPPLYYWFNQPNDAAHFKLRIILVLSAWIILILILATSNINYCLLNGQRAGCNVFTLFCKLIHLFLKVYDETYIHNIIAVTPKWWLYYFNILLCPNHFLFLLFI